MAESEAHLVEVDPRTRGNFAYRSGERGNFKTDGGDPRPLIPGLAMGPGCAEQHPNKAREGQREMEVTTIGIDLAKNVFAVRDADGSGRVAMRRQLKCVQVVVNAWAAAPQW